MNYTVAIAGNPNSGKSTIFNALTGLHQHIGNWSGVTVEKKYGEYKIGEHIINIVDLPGTYSLNPKSIDERIARDFIISKKSDLVVVVVNASDLEKSLTLLIDILEAGIKTLVVFNMMDMVKIQGKTIDIRTLEKILNIRILKTVAHKKIGTDRLKLSILQEIKTPTQQRFKIQYKERIETTIKKAIKYITVPENIGVNKRWIFLKFLEGENILNFSEETLKRLNEYKKIISDFLHSQNLELYFVEKRYAYVEGLIKETVKNELPLEKRIFISDRIDRIVTNKFLGIPIFILVMGAMFYLVFTIGTPLSNLIESFFEWISVIIKTFLTGLNISSIIISFIVDGIIGGVGSIIVFLPNIALLFLGIGILESSGYMARAAFIMDKFMHIFGLHGKSFIPMIMGFGCTVPAIMSARTLDSEKDRILTILVLPLMSCSARLPIYVLFASIFFPHKEAFVVLSLYFLGIIIAMIVARIFKNIFFKAKIAPLIVELPPYRMPVWKDIFISVWIKSKLFIKKAGTVILLAAVIMWVLASLPPGVEYASRESFIGKIGSFFAPVLKLSGFGFYEAAVALIMGFMAKELVVSSLGTLFGTTLRSSIQTLFTPISAYAFMIMSLVYVPCIATIATIKQEAGWKWSVIVILYSIILGWILATIFYQTSLLIKTIF